MQVAYFEYKSFSFRLKLSFYRHMVLQNRRRPLNIWPVYAYTLAAQKTVIKLPMLIIYTVDNTCSDIYIFCHRLVEIEVSVG